MSTKKLNRYSVVLHATGARKYPHFQPCRYAGEPCIWRARHATEPDRVTGSRSFLKKEEKGAGFYKRDRDGQRFQNDVLRVLTRLPHLVHVDQILDHVYITRLDNIERTFVFQFSVRLVKP